MKAIFVPQNLDLPMVEVEGDTLQDLCRTHTNIYWLETVNTSKLSDANLMMVVDEEGLMKTRTHSRNLRASLISLYPGALVGDALLVGTTWRDGGIDACDPPPRTLELLAERNIEGIAGRVS